MRYIIIFLVLIILSCRESSQKSIVQKNKKKSNRSSIEQESNINMNILEGAWGNEQDGNALFYIEGDSIYYTERQESPYSIEIKGNTFSVDYEGYSSKSEVVKLTKDSLVYKNEDNFTTKLFRME